MLYIFFLILISTIISYLILKFIYRIIFKSKKKISNILVFLGGVGLIIFYYTPYSFYLEPSYWQFKNMCKLNELPNDEEKYNKILKYFNTDLDTLDWEELNGRNQKLTEENFDYKKGIFEYITQIKLKQLNSRIDVRALFFSNESEINRYNANVMVFRVLWHTNRYFLERKYMTDLPHQAEWIERILGCSNDDNMTPKGENNE